MGIRVSLVQQGVWALSVASMPLAAGYLKAAADADERIRRRMDIAISNYGGSDDLSVMVNDLFRDGPPDILGFSVLGWNYRTFGALAETFKQINPRGWVIFGGNHVAHQAERTFRMSPDVDVVVNGEGELVFRDLLHAYLDGATRDGLHSIEGISFRDVDGKLVTTPPRERIQDLDILPSPILSGAIPLTDDKGHWPYDVALLETNRGCPYKCAFCYWGGAVGQRVQAFSRQRLREELTVLARHKVRAVTLCDANFGMLPADEEFVEDLLRIRRTYGYPQRLETSWAKNKSAVFYRIVAEMKRAGLHNSFVLSLQTLNDTALERMRRRNMKLNEWEDLTAWLAGEGIDCFFEMIWGAPGETVETFLQGYDRLTRHTPFVAVHPLMLLPNTEYHDKREQFGFVTFRGDRDDFQYVLSHETMTAEENRRMMRFITWNRLLARGWFRYIWTALRELADVPQSRAILNFAEWVERTDDPAAVRLRTEVRPASPNPESHGVRLGQLFSTDLFRQWWAESLRPGLSADRLPVLEEVFRYDLLTQPVYRGSDVSSQEADLPVVEAYGDRWYLRRDASFDYDVPALVAALRNGDPVEPRPEPFVTSLFYRVGFGTAMHHYHSISPYRGRTEQELRDVETGRALW